MRYIRQGIGLALGIALQASTLTGCASPAKAPDPIFTTGIIGALEEEVTELKSAMTASTVTEISGMEFCEGELDGAHVVVVQRNMGKVNAGICAQTLIREFHADQIINTGVAGSLDATLDIGDIVVSTDAVQHDYNVEPLGAKPGEMPDMGVDCFPADEGLRKKAVEAVQAVAPEVKAFEGRVCSGDQFISTHEEKDRITSTFGGLCCEMEGGAIAHVCWRNQTPFVIIRAISDKADDSEAVDYFTFKQEAAARCAKIARYIVSHG